MDPAGLPQLQGLLEKFIQISVGFAFIALVVMLIIGGFKYLTSGGEAKALSSATQTFTWAILGILILVVIWLVLKLIEAFTGVAVTQFCIGFPPYCINHPVQIR